MSNDLRESIGYQALGAAELRLRKAEEFPEDIGNAEGLKRLATEVERCEDSEIHNQIRAMTDRNGEDWDRIATSMFLPDFVQFVLNGFPKLALQLVPTTGIVRSRRC